MTIATPTKERPILFNTEMVQAILEGRKTQTRRLIKPQPIEEQGGFRYEKSKVHFYCNNAAIVSRQHLDFSPFGQVGDRLWIRETWCCLHGYGDTPNKEDFVRYKADSGAGEQVITDVKGWRPSIHMPRVYSRILLEITGIRVERIQDITPHDKQAEGIDYGDLLTKQHGELSMDDLYLFEAIDSEFQQLWDSINTKRGYGWNVNPWVWVIEFKKIEANG